MDRYSDFLSQCLRNNIISKSAFKKEHNLKCIPHLLFKNAKRSCFKCSGLVLWVTITSYRRFPMSLPPFFGVNGCANSRVDTPRSDNDLSDFCLGLEVQTSSCHRTFGKVCSLMKPALKDGGGRGIDPLCQVLEVFKPCFSMMFQSLRRLDCVMTSSGLSCSARR